MKRVSDFLVVLLVLFSSCASRSNEIVATAGNRPITLKDYEETYSKMDPEFLPEGKGKEARLKFLDDMINKELMAQEALKHGYDKNEKVSRQMDEQRKMILLQHLYRDLVTKKVKIKKRELRDLYKKRSEEFHAKHIVLGEKREADSLLAEIKKGAEFDSICYDHSIDQRSANIGGDLGFITANSGLDPEFEKALYGLKPGELCPEPVKTTAGYHILKVVERKKRTQEDFEKEKPILEKEAREKKEKILVRDVIEGLKKRHALKVEEKNLPTFSSILERRISAIRDTTRTAQPFKLAPEESSLVLIRFSDEVFTVGQYIKNEEGLPFFYWTRGNNIEELRKLLNHGQFTLNEILLREIAKRKIEKRKSVKEELTKKSEEFTVTQLYQDEIVGKAEVSDEEIKEEYERNPKKYEKDGKPIPFERAKMQIKQELVIAKQEENLTNYFKELRKSYPIKINEKVLEKAKLEHGK